jgi:two-component system LytT family response regulator
MKAVLVDDEYYALQGLRMILEEVGGVEVVGMYENGPSALEGIEAGSPDVVFLDIEMPEINGLELFLKILETSKNPNVVFVTAYEHYAVQAFELDALDYLVKPVQKTRLIKTLERLKTVIDQGITSKKITFHCFRHFSALAEGKEWNLGWRTKKAEELLAYLICEKGRFVAKEKIAEALWPNLDNAKSIANLYLAYYYLKKHSVLSSLIESERGKMRIRLEDADCDLINFDRIIQSCRDITDANIMTAEKGEAIYQGILLEDRYYAWILELQQQYELAYMDLLKKITVYYKKKHNPVKFQYYLGRLNQF